MEPHDRMSQMAKARGRDLWKAWKAEGLTRARGFYKESFLDTMKDFSWFFLFLTQRHWGPRNIITRITQLRCAPHNVSGYHLTPFDPLSIPACARQSPTLHNLRDFCLDQLEGGPEGPWVQPSGERAVKSDEGAGKEVTSGHHPTRG
jgi:hypothetical protein